MYGGMAASIGNMKIRVKIIRADTHLFPTVFDTANYR